MANQGSHESEVLERQFGDSNTNQEAYQHAIGQYNWLTTKARPDISYAVARLQKRLASPRIADDHAAEHLLRYLKGSKAYALVLGLKSNEGLAGYVDSSYADNPDGKFTEAYVFTFAGSPISWASKKQSITSTSSTLAEFCALTTAAKEAIWLKKLTVAMGLEKPGSVILYTDSANAIDIVKKNGYSSTTKWIDNRYFFIRDMIQNGQIEIKWIEGTMNLADGFTKPLERLRFERFREMMGMREIQTTEAAIIEEEEHMEDGIIPGF